MPKLAIYLQDSVVHHFHSVSLHFKRFHLKDKMLAIYTGVLHLIIPFLATSFAWQVTEMFFVDQQMHVSARFPKCKEKMFLTFSECMYPQDCQNTGQKCLCFCRSVNARITRLPK